MRFRVVLVKYLPYGKCEIILRIVKFSAAQKVKLKPPKRAVLAEKSTCFRKCFFLAGALGLEPRAYGFGVSHAILTTL